ncbi:MAG: PTS transporter subunit EIIC, partial [Varibaculum timonense]
EAAKTAADCPGVWDSAANTCEVVGVVGRYQAGFFPIMMFGLPGAALAIYLRSEDKKKKTVAALMMAGALASFFTGVTEPLEFSFMFVAPVLYLVHALLTGVSVAIAAAMHWTAGFGFSAGFVDMFLSAQNPVANKWYMLLVMGVVFFALYFVIFYALIGVMNMHTPGRELEDDELDMSDLEDVDPSSQAATILNGLGGAENIDTLDYCTTRLRVNVKDPLKINEKVIKAAKVAGIIRPGQKSIQVVIGPQVQFVYDDMAMLLKSSSAVLMGEQEE